jgi:hypothetical protein
MMKQLYALATIGALGGFVMLTSVAGCGSQGGKDDGDRSGSDSTQVDPNDPSSQKTEPPACKANVDFKPAETKPVAPRVPSACTAATIRALAEACVDEPNGSGCEAVRNAPGNKACADCIFGNKSDSVWKVVNLAPGETPEVIYNQEGCVENITGVKGCGHKYMTVLSCYIDYCGACNRQSGIQCLQQVAEGECKPYRIDDEACVKATEERQSAIAGCFPATEDAKGIRSLFNYMAGLACGGGQGDAAPAQGEGAAKP